MQRIVAVDFDGTIVEHRYPEIGKPVPGAIDFLLELQESGVRLVLWTMRSGVELEQAVEYCTGAGLTFFGVNNNPQQTSWTTSPKAYAQVYIDDAAAGCPLVRPMNGGRPFVDWAAIRTWWEANHE